MSWISIEETKRTWHTFRRDWTAIPRERRARFAITLTACWAGLALLMVGLSAALQAMITPEFEAREREWLARIVEAAPIDYDTAIFFESPGNGVILITLSIVLSILFARRGRPLWALSILAACLMSSLVVGLGWVVWDRERPDFLYEGLPNSGLSSFPSGHTSMSIPTYGLLAYLWLRRSCSSAERVVGVLAVLGAIAIVLTARVVVSAHWPTDILGGAVLGTVWLASVIAALRFGEAHTAAEPVGEPASAAPPQHRGR